MGDALSIVLADENPGDLALVQGILVQAGHQVRCACNGEEALRLLRAEESSVLIADWHLPAMDGLELCRRVRADEGLPFLYVIILTASEATSDHVAACYEAGADDCCAKPVNRRVLNARLRAARRILRLTRALESRTLEAHHANAKLTVVNEQLARANDQLRFAATTDELTGLRNRREAMTRLNEHWSATNRRLAPLSCMSIDLDRFKNYNDVHGHTVGDGVLRSVSAVLRATVRKHEMVYRMGGEEFLVLCPGAAEHEAAAGGERLRRAVEAHTIEIGQLHLHVTISVGIAQRGDTMRRPDDLLNEVDLALYSAKDAGRNSVVRASAITKRSRTRATTAPVPPEESPSRPVVIIATPGHGSTNLFEALKDEFEPREFDLHQPQVGAVLNTAPKAVLLDLTTLPAEGPVLVAQWHGALCPHGVPLIVTLPNGLDATVESCINAGAQECILSPFPPAEVVLRIRTIVGLQEQVVRSNEVRGEQSRALALLSEYSQEIAGAESLDRVLELTAQAAAALTCCRQAHVLMHHAESEKFEIAFSVSPEPKSQPHAQIGSVVLDSKNTLCGLALAARAPLAVESDEDRSAHRGRADCILLAEGPSLIAPILAPGAEVGALVLTQRQGVLDFSVSEQAYIELICNIGGAAIEEHLTRRARDDARHSIVVALARLAEYRDSDTGRHLDRVTRFCGLLARELRSNRAFASLINDRFLDDLDRAAPLHDIGKVAIPDRVLLKPGRLTPEEFEVMTTHTTIGAKTIRSVMDRAPGVSFLAMAEQIAYSHHEWFNGEGYPQRLKGNSIPLSARILAVADVYDAITSKRVYKLPMSHAEALSVIKSSAGKHFDPAVVGAFLVVASEFERLSSELNDTSSTEIGSSCHLMEPESECRSALVSVD